MTKVLISGGISRDANRNPTEVINLDGEDGTCQDLEDFPILLSHAVGANLGSSPVICGGQESNAKSIDNEIDTCFKLINGQWKSFTTMNDKRAVAAGVVYQNTLHIFGGLSGEEPQYGNIKACFICFCAAFHRNFCSEGYRNLCEKQRKSR